MSFEPFQIVNKLEIKVLQYRIMRSLEFAMFHSDFTQCLEILVQCRSLMQIIDFHV